VKFVNVFSLCLAALFFLNFLPSPRSFSPETPVVHVKSAPAVNTGFSYADSSRLNLIYDSLQLSDLGLSAAAYHKAVTGFLNLVLSGEVEIQGRAVVKRQVRTEGK